MSKKFLIPVLVLFLLVSTASVRIMEFTATVEGNNPHEVTLKWAVENDQNVKYFRIDRKMESDYSFRENYGTVQKGKAYEFIDRHVYKSSGQSESVYYKLFAVTNDQAIFLAETEVSYTTNSVRRTWGNIKSMFQ